MILRSDHFFLYNENLAIVEGFYVGFADEQRTNKKISEECPCVKGSLV